MRRAAVLTKESITLKLLQRQKEDSVKKRELWPPRVGGGEGPAYEFASACQPKGNIDDRRNELLAVIEYDPKNRAALMSLGQLAYEVGAYRQAAEYFTRSQRLCPGDSFTFYALGLTWQRLENMHRALRAYFGASRRGYHPEALYNAASLYSGRWYQDEKKAQRCWEMGDKVRRR